MLTITSTYAETHFNEVINQAQQEPVVLTAQGGQTVAYLLSPVELEKLLAAQKQRDNAVVNYQHYQERVARLAHPDTDLLTDEAINQLVHELR
jgi:PHD/YefM family antitoxin component YafN of YafNO toxin-antitoxin module